MLSLIAGGIGLAGSLLGGYLNNRAINKTRFTGIDAPEELQEQTDALSDPNYFLPLLQRLAGDATQGNYNINAQLASRGIDSQLMANELMQAGERQRAATIRQGVDAMEGTRLSMLNNLIGQKSSIASQNASMRNNFSLAKMGAKTSNISQMVGGATGSVVQGIGAKISQNNFNQLMQVGSQPTGAVNAGQTMGFGSNAYNSSLFGGGGFGSNLYG